jgi:hypothetical protein
MPNVFAVPCGQHVHTAPLMPRQFGPITRMPLARAVATSARSAKAPAGPDSLSDMTTRPRTRLRAHCARTSVAAGVGGWARALATWAAFGLTQ